MRPCGFKLQGFNNVEGVLTVCANILNARKNFHKVLRVQWIKVYDESEKIELEM